jgi:steroid 5-alpha reductase family enzyme
MNWTAFGWAALTAGSAVFALVAAAFVIGVLTRKHTAMDAAFGACIAIAAVASFLASAGDGDQGRRWLLLIAGAAWGFRLAWHVARRILGSGEDPRYAELMEAASGNVNWYALRKVYLLQLLILWVILLPLPAGMVQGRGLSAVTVIGFAVWVAGFFFEVVGDWQLTRFKADPANKGKVMDRGLWRYTRHPNYFGDACMWWGLFLLSYAVPVQLVTLVSPVLMTFVLTRGTGQRMTERRMSSGGRPGYAEYVARTSGFFPLPPRRPRPVP